MLSLGICRSGRRQSKNKRKQKDRKILARVQRTKKAGEHEGDGDANCIWCTWDGPERLEIGTRIGNQRIIRKHQDILDT